jgi:hypothetical protein
MEQCGCGNHTRRYGPGPLGQEIVMGCQSAGLLPRQASVTVRNGLDELFKARHV